MKIKIALIISAALMLLCTSCKKDNTSIIQVNFTNNTAEGVADANGEFNLTGHIFSAVPLSRVTLTKQAESDVFMTDETTAKNKKEYDFSYGITGIDANTTIIMDVYDQNGARYSSQFFIIKQ